MPQNNKYFKTYDIFRALYDFDYEKVAKVMAYTNHTWCGEEVTEDMLIEKACDLLEEAVNIFDGDHSFAASGGLYAEALIQDGHPTLNLHFRLEESEWIVETPKT